MAAMRARRDRPLIASILSPFWFMLLVLLVRAGIVYAMYDRLAADPDGYRALADNLIEHGVLGRDQQPSAYRPPLYPILLTACVATPRPDLAIGIMHVVLGLPTVWLTVWLARRWGLGGFSYLAGGMVACDPMLLNQSTLVMTETLATLLAVVSLTLVTLAAEANGRRHIVLAALTGASFALATLCRPTFLISLVFTATALTWIERNWRQRASGLLAMALAAALVLLPWVARNFSQFGKPIVTTTHGGYTLLLGNNRDYYEFLRAAPWRAVWRANQLDASLSASRSADEVENDRHEYELAWQAIRRQPGMFLYATLLRVGALWGVLPHRTSEHETSAARLVRYAVAGWYLVVFGLALAAIGCGAARVTRLPWLWAVMLAMSFSAVHLVYWTDLRMRAPLIPAISLVAAAGAKRLFDANQKT